MAQGGIISSCEPRCRLQRSLLLLPGCVPSTAPLPLPSHSDTGSSQSSQSAPSHWRKQRSQRVHGRLSLGKMQWGRETHRGKRQGRQTVQISFFIDAGRWLKKKAFFSVSLSDSNQPRLLTQCRVTLFGVGRSEMGIEEHIQDLLSSPSPPTLSGGQARLSASRIKFCSCLQEKSTRKQLWTSLWLCVSKGEAEGELPDPCRGVFPKLAHRQSRISPCVQLLVSYLLTGKDD